MQNRSAKAALLLASVFVLGSGERLGAQQQKQSAEGNDKYTWLEDVSSERSLAWVKAEDERTAGVLEADPHFATYQAEALKLAEDPDRLPTPSLRGDRVYNFWRDAQHQRGILRQTSLADYLSIKPDWQT